MQSGAKIIDGELFKHVTLSGARNLKSNVVTVNNLNVFPIPDGDTGDNMYLTMSGGTERIKNFNSASVGDLATAFADGALLNARGNSGVILSQLFFGLSEGLKNLKSATVMQFANAMKQGVARAYGAVAEPVEGTMLTVAREAIEFTLPRITEDTDVKGFFSSVLSEMKKSLERTPELLPVLKESGVIDSGGAGLVSILEGVLSSFNENAVLEVAATESTQAAKSIDFSKFNENSVMEFGYCTEMLLQLMRSKTDVDAFNVSELIAFLSGIGDSIVAVKVGTVVKLHVHTMTPYKVMEYCQRFGEFLTVKIENMTLQHNESELAKEKSSLSEINAKVKRARKDYAVVTVASGKGIINMFKELGADYVVSGGQTDNPSANDFIRAFDEVNADVIFVLPNNSNIILAANQAAEMYKKSVVRIIPSKSIGEGYSALSTLDVESGDTEQIVKSAIQDMSGASTGMVSHAIRTTVCNGVSVNKGDFMGFSNKEMIVSTPNKMQTAFALAKKLGENKSFVIAIYGKGVLDKEKSDFAEFIKNELPDVEFYEIDGEQEVYDFIMIAE